VTFTACTIAARHQLAHARALARSLRVLDPPVALHVLVVDDRAMDVVAAAEPFAVVRPGDLDVSRYELLAGIHALPELTEVLRPALLRHVLDRTRGSVVILDVDMLAFADLAELGDIARRHRVALVPRLLAAVPRDHVRVTDEDVMKRGVFDQGLCAMSPAEEVDHFLRQWSDRVELDLADERPLASARFLDLAPGILSTSAIVRDPGLGLSTLNLHERHLGGGPPFTCAGRPLRLVHCAGLDGVRRPPDDPFCGPVDRRDPPDADWDQSPDGRRETVQRGLVATDSALGRLVAERDKSLASSDAASDYGYERLADGTPLGRRLRRAIRDAELHGGLALSPFSPEGTMALLGWLNAPAISGGRHGITRYWWTIYSERTDLRMIHPDLDGAGGPGLLQWIVELGQADYATPDSLMPITARAG
jgi:hypothetical protein